MLILLIATLNYGQTVIASYELNGNGEDSGPNNYTAVINGAIPTEDRFGNPNGALFFDGIDDYLEVANNSALNFGENDFAISFWIKTSSPQIQMLIHNGASGQMPQYWVRLKDYSSEEINLKFLTSDGIPASLFITYDNDPTIYDGTWHHIVVQRKDFWHEIFYDGNLVSTIENQEIKNIENDDNMLIGAQHPHPSNGIPDIFNYFEGSLDDITFYLGALSEEQVNEIYNEEVTSIKSIKNTEAQVKLFPNPAKDKLEINYFNIHEVSIVIFDTNGKQVKSFDGLQRSIDISSLSSGMYVIEFQIGRKSITKKFMKK